MGDKNFILSKNIQIAPFRKISDFITNANFNVL